MEYTNLDIWIECRKLTNIVYDFTKTFPKEEIFGLTNQMRRSAVSIPSNIAEGNGRRTTNDTLQFLYISRGSIFELETQIYLALDLKYNLLRSYCIFCTNLVLNLQLCIYFHYQIHFCIFDLYIINS